jgi:hypothetical protein
MSRVQVGRRFAILFAGAADKYHLNDLELSYRMLIRVFDYHPGHIRVLFHDGQQDGRLFRNDTRLRKWPGSTTDPDFQIKVHGAGTKAAFRKVIDELVNDFRFGAHDSLFLHAEGHGGHDAGDPDEKAFLASPTDTFEKSQYTAEELSADLQKLDASRSLLVLMNQCYGGAFKTSILNGSKAAKTYVACAAGAWKRAFPAGDLDRKWSAFALDWMEAQMGVRVNGDPLPVEPPRNPDGTMAAAEAFGYALAHSEHKDSPNFGAKPDPAAGVITLR